MKSKQIMTGFALLMLGYQAWRVYDYMRGSLSGVDETTSMIVALAFLSFSELGLLAWLHLGRKNATTDAQEAVSSAMIWVDFLGSMIVGLGDLLKHNTMYTIDLSAFDPILFLAPWLMVALNLGGYLIYTQNDSEDKLEREERRLQHEEHSLEMAARRKAISDLHANQQGIADQLAPHYFKHVRDRVTGRTSARFEKQANQLPSPSAPAIGKAARSFPAEAPKLPGNKPPDFPNPPQP